MNYFNTCKQHILDTIDEYVGYEHEISDMGMALTDRENIDSSWYCSTYKAKQDLSKWLEEGDTIESFIEEYKEEFGNKPPYDGLTEPESFHCLMMIVGVEKLFNSLDIVQDNWNKSKKITKTFANKVKSELKQMSDFE